MRKVLQGDIMKIIFNISLFFVCFLFLFACITDKTITQEGVVFEQNRYYDESLGFSIIRSKAWQATEISGYRYTVFLGQIEYNFVTNFVFDINIYNAQLNEYVDYFFERVYNVLNEDFLILQREIFITDKNLYGEKITANITYHERYFRQIIYFFPGKNDIKMHIVCSVPIEVGDSYDIIFDEIMKSFEWLNP